MLRESGYCLAGPLFVRNLIERKITGEHVGNLVDAFVKLVKADKEGVSLQVNRVAMKAGLVAAAGELAIEFGLVPWPAGAAIDAAKYVFEQWLARRGTSGSHEVLEAMRKLQALFEQSGVSRFDRLHTITKADLEDPLPGESPSQVTGTIDPNDPPFTSHNSGRAPSARRLGWVAGLGEKQRWYIAPQTWEDLVTEWFPLKVINAELEKSGALEFDTRMDRGKPRKRLKEPMINGLRAPFYVVTPKILQVAFDPSEEGRFD